MGVDQETVIVKWSNLDSSIFAKSVYQRFAICSKIVDVSLIFHVKAMVASSESETIVPNQRLVTDGVEILVISGVLYQKDGLVKSVLFIVVPSEISEPDKRLVELLGVSSDSVLNLEQITVCLT